MATSSSTTTLDLPDYMEQPIRRGLGDIEDWIDSDFNYIYGSKPGETIYTGLSDMQRESLGNIDWLGDQDLSAMFGIDRAESLLGDFADYDPASLTPERVVDEGGYLGGIEGYVNPYLEQVLAPQVRNIEEATQRRLNDLGASAASAGSFGDARHGVNESLVYRDANRAIGDVTGQAYRDAWNTAMGLRGNDLMTRYGVEAGNRAADMEANQNRLAAASGMAELGDRYFNTFMDVNDALYNAGEIERTAEIERNEIMRQFQEAVNSRDYDSALKLIMAAQGVPYETTTTQQTTQQQDRSNDGLWGLIGAGLGALF